MNARPGEYDGDFARLNAVRAPLNLSPNKSDRLFPNLRQAFCA
jgi:hypothetical protein